MYTVTMTRQRTGFIGAEKDIPVYTQCEQLASTLRQVTRRTMVLAVAEIHLLTKISITTEMCLLYTSYDNPYSQGTLLTPTPAGWEHKTSRFDTTITRK